MRNKRLFMLCFLILMPWIATSAIGEEISTLDRNKDSMKFVSPYLKRGNFISQQESSTIGQMVVSPCKAKEIALINTSKKRIAFQAFCIEENSVFYEIIYSEVTSQTSNAECLQQNLVSLDSLRERCKSIEDSLKNEYENLLEDFCTSCPSLSGSFDWYYNCLSSGSPGSDSEYNSRVAN